LSLSLGTTLTCQYFIQEEIKSRLKSGNACYYLVQDILCSRIISSTNFNAQFSLFINNMFVTLLSTTCFEH